MESKLMFFSNFLENPKQVAALVPSSKWLIRRIVQNINFRKKNYIVEFGAGTGILTKQLLKNLGKDSKLICFEVNKQFNSYLEDHVKDTRLTIINDTAGNLDIHLKNLKIKKVDYVISSIPFALIKSEDRKSIICKSRNSLKNGGKLIIYQQYTNIIKKYLRQFFDKISINYEIWNLPPTFIFICEKNETKD